MPAMLRSNKVATKIVYTILGKPMNMDTKDPYKNPNTKRKLEFEDGQNGYSGY